MEHVNGWWFREIYKGGLWDDDLHVCVPVWRYSLLLKWNMLLSGTVSIISLTALVGIPCDILFF